MSYLVSQISNWRLNEVSAQSLTTPLRPQITTYPISRQFEKLPLHRQILRTKYTATKQPKIEQIKKTGAI